MNAKAVWLGVSPAGGPLLVIGGIPGVRRSAIARYLTEVISTALPILPYDTVATVHDLILVTDNLRDFEHCPGLRVERWHRTSKRVSA